MGDLHSQRWAAVADAHLPTIAKSLKRIADVLERQEKASARPHRSPDSETFATLEKAAQKHGWNEATMLDLLCRFVDNVDILADHTEEVVPSLFEDWLDNKAAWEKIDE